MPVECRPNWQVEWHATANEAKRDAIYRRVGSTSRMVGALVGSLARSIAPASPEGCFAAVRGWFAPRGAPTLVANKWWLVEIEGRRGQ